MVEDKMRTQLLHNVIMENREKLNISGVNEVISFDEQCICISTQMGLLTIKGNGLKLNRLNLDNTELLIEGQILSMIYSEDYAKLGFFQKLFK